MEETEMGIMDVLVCGGDAEISRYPAEEGGRSQNFFLPRTTPHQLQQPSLGT
jgi:hypothetical protein